MSIEESITEISSWKRIQYDSETSGRDCHINDLLCVQFGNDKADKQIVVDTTTVDIKLYKEVLENKLLIGHNLKFDLEFLYNYNIVPLRVYDTMIVEQLLHLGYPSGVISYSLKAVAWERLKVDIDKTVRGEIIWRGLDVDVIKYSAGDVMYLEKILNSQYEDLKKQDLIKAALIENAFVPAIAYLEWCGIKLDVTKWQDKMANDKKALEKAAKDLNDFVCTTAELYQFTEVDLQGDLFAEVPYNTEPKCTINWSSSQQVIKVAKILGFNTIVKDKKTGKDKDSVLEKHLASQKGINDDFLKLYFTYQEKAKVVSTFGQPQLNMINPNTGRCHTTYKQLGASSGRLSCGSQQSNTDLAKLKKLSPSEVTYCNFQQLPADEPTRSSFVAEKGGVFCSCDWSAIEARLGADIYDDPEMLKEYTEGAGDSHSMYAWLVFRKECEALGCKSAKDVKKLAPQWRKKVKGVEFCYQFGGAAPTLAQSAGCSIEQAQKYIDDLNKGFSGMTKFAQEGSKFVRKNGYVLMCKDSGHKMYWWDHSEWLKRQQSFTSAFWEEYKKHKGTGDDIAMMVKQHFQAASKWDRMARNAVTQGTGAVCLKVAVTQLFNWVVENNYFGIIKLNALVHDETCWDYPKELEEGDYPFSKRVSDTMQSAAAMFCHKLPIPAEAAVGTYWIH